jgi:ketosteroid isomerase-like protein
MKNHLTRFTLVLVVGAVWLAGCKNTGELREQEKLAISDTINILMDQVMHFAENASADSTFQWLSDDSAAVFMTGGMAFSAQEITTLFRNAYGIIKSQQMDPLSTRTLVFSPEAAAWIGILKEKAISKEDEVTEKYIVETWLWQRENSGWKVVHYHESWMTLPDACKKATVEYALEDLAKDLRGKALKPADMPPILTKFLTENPLIYGATLVLAPSANDGKRQPAGPYVFRSGNEFKQVYLPEEFDYTLSEWYAVPVDQKKPAWSNPYFDDGGGGVVMVTYSIPMYDEQGNLTGVLTSDLDLK